MGATHDVSMTCVSRLHSELRRSLETQLQVSGGEGGGASLAVEGLQHQLDVISKVDSSDVMLYEVQAVYNVILNDVFRR